MADPIIDAIVSIGTNIISSIIYDFAKSISADKIRFFPNSLLLSKEAIRTLDQRVEKFLENRRWEYSIHPVLHAYFRIDDSSDVTRLKPLISAALFNEQYSAEACQDTLERLRISELERANNLAKNKRNAVRPDIKKYALDKIDIETFNDRNIKELRNTLFENDEISRFFVSRVLMATEAFSREHSLINKRAGAAPDNILLEYCEEIRARTSRLMTSGIDAFLRQEQIESQLEASFVSLSLRELWRHTADGVSENAEQLFREFKYIVARGDAGSGKTTLLQWISLQCAKSILGQPQSKESAVSWDSMIPFFIPLRRIVTNYGGRINVSDFVILSTDSLDLSRKIGPNWITEILIHRNSLVMFDGLDELGFKDRSAFWAFIRNFVQKYPRSKVIVTSRHLSHTHTADGGYKNIFSMNMREFSSHRWEWNPPPGFVDFQIAPLTNNQIHVFVRRWHQGLSRDVLHPDIIDQIEAFPRSLIKTIESPKHEDVKSLCKIPLLCALVCIVNLFSQGHLPDSLRKLYAQSVRILSQTRDEVRNVPAAAEYRLLGQPIRTDILGHVALTMQEGATRANGQMALEVDMNDVLTWIENYRARQGGLATQLSNEDVLRFYTERTNILREPTLGKIDFIHRSFLEFLAANEFVRRREVFTIKPLLFDDSWTGVLKFMMDTEEGGSFFAGAVVDCFTSETTNRNAETKLQRLSEIMTYSNRVPDSKFLAIHDLLLKMWPPNTGQAAAGLRNLPIESFLELLDYSSIAANEPDIRANVVRLICSHSDNRIRSRLASGYLEDTSPEVAFAINNYRCAPLKDHSGLWPALAQLLGEGSNHLSLSGVDLICDDAKELLAGWQNTLFRLPGVADQWKCFARVIINDSTHHLNELRHADFVVRLGIETEEIDFLERVKRIVNLNGFSTVEIIGSPAGS
jgi:hypothetical protein